MVVRRLAALGALGLELEALLVLSLQQRITLAHDEEGAVSPDRSLQLQGHWTTSAPTKAWEGLAATGGLCGSQITPLPTPKAWAGVE